MLKIGHVSPWLRLWRIRDGHLTNIRNRREKRDNSHCPIYDFRACERLAHCANATNIECDATYLVHPCTPHLGGTPLENPGTPWGVRYTRLTSTVVNSVGIHVTILAGTPIARNITITYTKRYLQIFKAGHLFQRRIAWFLTKPQNRLYFTESDLSESLWNKSGKCLET